MIKPGTRRPLQPHLLALLTFLLVSCAALDPTNPSPTILPAQCQNHCVTPYGQFLGTAPGQVAAYSNCNAYCVVFAPNTQHGTYTGLQWQCVEFARRWLLDHKGMVYGDVDVAADLWNKIQTVTRVTDGQSFPLQAYLNGATSAPQVGDLLIYGREYLNTGHVAIVTAVDLTTGTLKVAEQNYLNQPWPGDYARQLDLIQKNGRYWLLDPHLIGWKRVAG